MYSLYTSKSVLESIWNMGETCKWYKLFERTDIKEIFIPEDFELKAVDTMGPQDELSAINQYIQIKPNSKHLELTKEKKDSEFINCVKKSTNALFLDENVLDDADLKYVGEEMGIFCQRLSDSNEILFNPIKNYPLKKGNRGFSWSSFLLKMKRIPTKSAIICDRNIFSTDCLVGCRNLKSILENLIVSKRRTEYSFIVFFEKFSDEHRTENNEKNVQNVLNDLKKFLFDKITHGGLPLITAKIDLVSVSRNNPYFEITHDRVVYCDYYTIGATHAIAAFDKNDVSQKTQTISLSALFSSVDTSVSDIIQQRKNVFPDYRKIFEDGIGVQCYRITGDDTKKISARECLNGCQLLVDATTK